MEDKGVFLLDLPLPSFSYPSLFVETPKTVNVCLVLEPKPLESESLGESRLANSSELTTTRPLQVYSRRNATIIDPVQVQEFVPSPLNEVINASPSSFPEYIDLDLPIAVRKAIRSCTQHPLSNFVSFNRFSPLH